jgi:hypothetical protein
MKYSEFIKKLVQDMEAYEFYTIFCNPEVKLTEQQIEKDAASIKKEAKVREDAKLKKAYENYKNPIPDPFLDAPKPNPEPLGNRVPEPNPLLETIKKMEDALKKAGDEIKSLKAENATIRSSRRNLEAQLMQLKAAVNNIK